MTQSPPCDDHHLEISSWRTLSSVWQYTTYDPVRISDERVWIMGKWEKMYPRQNDLVDRVSILNASLKDIELRIKIDIL